MLGLDSLFDIKQARFSVCKLDDIKHRSGVTRLIAELNNLIYCSNDKEGWGKCSWSGATVHGVEHREADVTNKLIIKDCKVSWRRCR